MVSKVAVIALVAIVAAPILLGYALNLDQVSVTDYQSQKDSVNVSGLLQNSTSYTSAVGDVFQLNTNFTVDGLKTYPNYEEYTTTATTYPHIQQTFIGWTGGTQPLSGLESYAVNVDYTYASGSYVTASFYSGSTLLGSTSYLVHITYDRATDSITYHDQTGVNSYYSNTISGGNYTAIVYTLVNLASVNIVYDYVYTNNYVTYTDLSGGFHFTKSPWERTGWAITLPEKSYSALLTVNLDSITDANYSVQLKGIGLTKTTVDGVVNWRAGISIYGYSQSYDLYYNPNISDNTYQILYYYPDETRPSDVPNTAYFHRFVEFRYVGSWPDMFGVANYYQKYNFEYWQLSNPSSAYLDSIYIPLNAAGKTPTMRVDTAEFLGFQYMVIEDTNYDPAAFRQNPSTTISNIQKYGTSIQFGGSTFLVNSGNITLGSHSIPVNGLVFTSTLNDGGTYDNKIGNTLISTTATPSTIEFGGKWSADVSTASMQQITYTKTEWTPGEFGWNGIDQNFLMVGLLTSLGAFIALGIVYRRTKAAIWPLMIVCGGAAAVFFIML